MALWQFQLDLIPAAAATIGAAPAIRMPRGQLDEVRLDIAGSDMPLLFEGLSAILPEKKAWNAQLRIWGDEKADDVQIWFDGEVIESMQVRIDAFKGSLAIIEGLCRLAREHGIVFATQDGAILRPQAEAIVRALLQSPAAKFVDDPRAYLNSAALFDAGEPLP